MTEPTVVSRAEWLAARRELLVKEKAFLAARDALSAERRALPWVAVDTPYAFDTTEGTKTLAELFAGRSQLIVYHFMFDPSWDVGCKSCSFVTDHLQHAATHLAQRDVTLLAVSRAPLPKLEAFKARQGWTHTWVSSANTDFNFDFDASFTPEQIESGEVHYNFAPTKAWGTEAPGLSVFALRDGKVYRTYSTYSRGLDPLITTYHYLDLTPKGRDEAGLEFAMAWVRLRDQYPAG